MSDNFEYIDVDDDDYFDAPKALRDHVKRLQERLTSVTEERDTFHRQVQTRSVNDVLADKGFKNPKRVARDLLADKVDPSNEAAVSKWLEENADDYARSEVQSASGAAPEGEGSEESGQDDGTAQTQNALESMQRTTTGAPPAGHDKYQAAFNEIDPSWSAEKVRQHLVNKGL
jgi:hypothetical protein